MAEERTPNDRRDWVFTFGFDHIAEDGTALRDRFVRIHGTYDEARTEMFRLFGRKWAFQYDSEDMAGVARYGLTRYEPENLGAD